MRQIVDKLVYDTDTAQQIAVNKEPLSGWEGNIPYLQILYKTSNGRFFVYLEYTSRFQKWQLGERYHWIHPVDDEVTYKLLCEWGLSPMLAGFTEPQPA